MINMYSILDDATKVVRQQALEEFTESLISTKRYWVMVTKLIIWVFLLWFSLVAGILLPIKLLFFL